MSKLQAIAAKLNGQQFLIDPLLIIEAKKQSKKSFTDWLNNASLDRLNDRLGLMLKHKNEVTADQLATLQDYFTIGTIAEYGIYEALLHDFKVEYNTDQANQSNNWWDLDVEGCKIDVKLLGNNADRTCISWNCFSKVSTAFLAPAEVALLVCRLIKVNHDWYVVPIILINQEALRANLRVSSFDNDSYYRKHELVNNILTADPFVRHLKVVILLNSNYTRPYINDGIWQLNSLLQNGINNF